MEFSPNNKVVKLCLQAMELESAGGMAEAKALFMVAWNEAADDSEKFIAAHYVARHQESASARLEWLETDLRLALAINDDSVRSALPLLYARIAECHDELGAPDKAKEYRALATSFRDFFSDPGPFYHGTKADLRVGDLLTPGGASNYQPDLRMNHIYFTSRVHGAGLAASLAKGDGRERVYVVEPTGAVENDPNVTNNKFPGNPTRSYRSREPLKIVGEATDWARQSPNDLQEWRAKLAKGSGKIVN
ncbi:NAD(+)--rifampin ADP-ribosyltransferase [Opitutaceae bacterium EW11]|nr:NAD(+)--rifampin ADP-ribosyltransferase [Opitutaceae bacterium EW11]